jgi:hypothetical protein
MDNVATASRDDENRNPESSELARLLSELIRAGWQLHFQLIPNEWMAVSQAEIIFERAWDIDRPRTAQEAMQALKQGLTPQAPVHWKFDPFDPPSIHKAVKRFHQLFVAPSRKE